MFLEKWRNKNKKIITCLNYEYVNVNIVVRYISLAMTEYKIRVH